jgi:hypothetical protein
MAFARQGDCRCPGAHAVRYSRTPSLNLFERAGIEHGCACMQREVRWAPYFLVFGCGRTDSPRGRGTANSSSTYIVQLKGEGMAPPVFRSHSSLTVHVAAASGAQRQNHHQRHQLLPERVVARLRMLSKGSTLCKAAGAHLVERSRF